MAKTSILSTYRRELDSINDQLCFSAFYSFEASRNIQGMASSSCTRYTTDLFSDNPFAERIHVIQTELASFEEVSLRRSAQLAMQAGVEVIQSYFSAVRRYIVELHGDTLDSKPGADDERLQADLARLSYPITSEIFGTVAYLRRRRNHLVHMLEEPASEMVTFWNKEANSLSAFWDQRPAELFGFNFCSKDLGSFCIEDGFAMMNLLRICVSEVDSAIGENISVELMVSDTARINLKRKSSLKGDHRRLVRSINNSVTNRFGRALKQSDIIESLEKF